MKKIDSYELFLFDFDGLLVDTERLHFLAYQELCRRHGGRLSWDFTRFVQEAHGQAMGIWGGLQRDVPEVFSQGIDKAVLYQEKKGIYFELLQSVPVEWMAGAERLLERLATKNRARALVTNSPRLHLEWIAKRLPLLKSIPLWVTREDYHLPKPDPEGYLKAIDAYGIPSCLAIGFEDSLKGIQALVAAKVDAMFVGPVDHPHRAEALALGACPLQSLVLDLG